MVTKIGTSGRDILHGTDATDLLNGLGGNDGLFGGGGVDRIFGGAGNDRVFGGAGNDALQGGDGNDVLDGGIGNDTLFGGTGNDFMLPGAGADVVNGGGGIDTVSYANAAGNLGITVGDAAPSYGGGAAAGDAYFSIETVVGSAFGDELFVYGNGAALGGPGDDYIQHEAGAGVATLRGDRGNDKLVGGSGIDRFWLQYNQGADIVAGSFAGGQDKFLISAAEFNLSATLVGHSLPAGAFVFEPNGSFRATEDDQRIIYHAGFIWGDPDGRGSHYHAVPIADVTEMTGLFAVTDFQVVA